MELLFRVSARNEIGYGPYSDEFAIIAATVPDAPTDFVQDLSASIDQVKFSWSAPSDGGSEILYYSVFSKRIELEV